MGGTETGALVLDHWRGERGSLRGGGTAEPGRASAFGQRGQQSQVPWCVWVVDMLGQNLHRHAAHDALDVIDEV
jgi:hypothetical protein